MTCAYPVSRSVTRRKALMISCAAAAIACVLVQPREAKAQAFQGTPTTADAVTFNRSNPGVETIHVGSPTATINWSPNQQLNEAGNIDFLPQGHVATFVGGSGAGNYTVLNRVVPDGNFAIELNGEIYSYMFGSESPGGNIWFYSPGGILVGSQAVIDVGSLLLTALDPGTEWTTSDSGFTASFFMAGETAGAINILDGARINALGEGSYVAMIAPRIEQGGNVQVNGSAGYAAAEQLTMTVNQGLFDISVDIGTDDANGIVHTGTTGGPASSGTGDNQRIAMVVVPKNQALTMLLSGNIGFDTATDVSVRNGEIVLSAGYNIGMYENGFSGWQPQPEVPASISIGNAQVTSTTNAWATTDILAEADGGSLSFTNAHWVSLYAGGSVHAGAINDGSFTTDGRLQLSGWDSAAGDVLLYANSGGTVHIGGAAFLGSGGHSSQAGSAAIVADGGHITVAGHTGIYASAGNGAPVDGTTVSMDAQGGNVRIDAVNNGSVTLNSGAYLDASATGQDNAGGGEGIAGDGVGGTIDIYAAGGGSVVVNGGVNAVASGTGGEALIGATAGGLGQGGSVVLAAEGGEISVSGSVTLSATGSGGSVSDPLASGAGAIGTGGATGIETHGLNSSIRIGGGAYLHTGADGGDGQSGGAAFGGVSWVESFGGDIAVTGAIEMYAIGNGGDANVGYGGSGGYGQGGVAAIEAHVIEGVAASVTGGDVHLNAGAYGGTGGAGDGVEIAAGSGGDAQGGLHNGERGSGGVHVIADSRGGVLSLDNVTIYANAHGGAGGTGGAGQMGGSGGNAIGGTVTAGTFNPDPTNTAALAEVTFGNFIAYAGGYGGAGGAGNDGVGGIQGAGGTGYGGGYCGEVNACGGIIIGARGTVEFADASLAAHGWGGDGSVGGNGIGGDVTVLVLPGGSLTSAASLELSTTAWGGYGSSGSGGNATGGWSGLLVDNGSVAIEGENLVIASSAHAGYGNGAEASGGLAIGGDSVLLITNGGEVATPGFVNLSSAAFGGGGTAQGGDGLAGSSTIDIDGGILAAGSIGNYANAWGGYGHFGGSATGGSASITIGELGGTLAVTGGAGIEAGAFGGSAGSITEGSGGHGGSALGGTATLDIAAAGTADVGSIYAWTSARGGTGGSGTTGGVGGDGVAGVSTLNVDGALTATNYADAYAIGTGGAGGVGTSVGGQGGSGYGGTTSATVNGTVTAGALTATSRAFGGAGGTGPTHGNGGYAEAGSSSLDIAGDATIDGIYVNATSFGGQGANGGEGVAGSSSAQVTGTLMTGDLEVTAQGFGGAGLSGAGGNGTGGSSTLDVSGIVDASNGEFGNVFMGNGGYGGNGVTAGGIGQAGSTTINVSGSLDIGTLLRIEGWATGGQASSGIGGFAEGGLVSITVGEGGSFTGGDVIATVAATGGNGGSDGGDALGGTTDLYVEGTVTAGGVELNATATGGAGSDGEGGEARGGASLVEVGGGTLTVTGPTQVLADAIGGSGTTTGGNAYGGATDVYLFEGTANLQGDTLLSVNAIGGAASAGTAGSSMGGDAYLDLWGSSLAANTMEITATGQTGGYAEAGLTNSTMTANALTLNANGTTDGGTAELYVGTVSGTPSSLTTGTFTASANGGTAGGEVYVDVGPGSSVDLGIATLLASGGATGFVQLLADGGNIAASSLTALSGNDIQFLLQNGGNIDVSGLIHGRAGGVIALDDNAGGTLSASVLDLGSNGGITNSADLVVADLIFATLGNLTLGDLSATDLLSLSSGGSLTTGHLVSGGGIGLATSGTLQTGDMTAAGLIDIDAMGGVAFGNVDAGSITFDSMGSVTGGNIIADTLVNGLTEGAIALGDITVGPGPEPAGELSVGLASNTSITVGDVNSYGRVGFATAGDLVTGEIQAGPLVMALVSGDINVGAITTAPDGIVYMGHGSMYLAAGGSEDNFDPALVLAATPVATGGAISIDGDVAAGSVQAYAGTDLTTGFINAATDIQLQAGGLLTTGDLLAGDVIAGQAGGNVQIGDATAGESIALVTGGSIIAGILDAPTVSLSVAGDFTTGDLFVDDTLLLAAGGNLTTGNITSGGSLGLTAGQALQAGNLTAGGDLTLNAGGSIAAGSLTAGAGIAAAAGTTLAVGDVTSGHVAPPPVFEGEKITAAAVAAGENVSLTSGGDLTAGVITSGEGILLNAGGTLTASDMTAAAGIAATSAGNMQIGNSAAGGDLSLSSGGDLTTGDLAGQIVTTTAAGASSVGAVNAALDAVFTAGGLATFNGVVSAPTITVTSSDITIADAASLGVAGVTSLLTLNAVSNGGEIIIGGGDEGAAEGQYQLSEAGDMIADAIVVNAVAQTTGGSAPDVRVYDVLIEGSQTSGGGVGSVTLNTGGSVYVEGGVNYTNAGAGDILAINAGERIAVITDTGSIAMTDSAGNLSGTLELTAHDIWVADQALIDQLEADPDFPGFEEALAINNGEDNPEGNVQAGGMTVTMLASSFLVQNTGTSDAPAGLSVGDGGLTIINQGSDPATVVLYGRQVQSDGTVTGGEEFAAAVKFDGSGGYTDSSRINGCNVAGGCTSQEAPILGAESILGPIGMMSSTSGSAGPGDGSSEEDEEEGGDSESGTDASFQLIKSGPLQVDTTIDEPVTSGSDSPYGPN